ncbi:MAG: hypothetical protein ACTHKN_10885 [Achromobacter mucicolens]
MAYFVLKGDVTVAITREYDLNDDLSHLPDDHEVEISRDKKKHLVTEQDVVLARLFGLEESRYEGTPGTVDFIAQELFKAECPGYDLITEAPGLAVDYEILDSNIVRIRIVSNDLEYTENRHADIDD